MRAADQIELVDITPEALRRRLFHGNVYPPERVDAALEGYFRPGNLIALRQLALLWLADQVDAALAKYRSDKNITDTWEARERVVVGVSGGPESETLVRRASRIASRSGAELKVVHVIQGDGLTAISPQEKKAVRELATSLGATMHTVVGGDVATTLMDFAHNANATQLVLGTSRRSRWARIFDEGVGAERHSAIRPVDVHMVTASRIPHRHLLVAIDPTAQELPVLVGRPGDPGAHLRVRDVVARGHPGAQRPERVVLHRCAGRRRWSVVIGPAALCAVLSGVLLGYFLVSPRTQLHRLTTRTASSRSWFCCWSRWASPPWWGGPPTGWPRHGGPRRKPNCSRPSPIPRYATPIWTYCSNASGRRIRNGR